MHYNGENVSDSLFGIDAPSSSDYYGVSQQQHTVSPDIWIKSVSDAIEL